ncbi:Metallo-dependent phosphatase [Artomyces pyxidatus]|uniref:Metallo-dependent phosphatase n=1 Tax=Artomyces pyxidatus TaxID=48021 RepID=A0ACB8T9X2_9AGAM|nr:Metallo-dependent phosphatase [Artomyces pyxidatus]
MAQSSLRRIASFSILLTFLVFVLSLGIARELTGRLTDAYSSAGKGWNGDTSYPEFSQYVPSRSVSAHQLALEDPDRRAIIIGDIHGMYDALTALLEKVSYNPDKDTLIHVGDISAKGPQAGSISVLSYMTSHNITGVRGNHDQKVIEWRAWVEWMKGLGMGAGAMWLESIEAQWAAATRKSDVDEEMWVKAQRKKGTKEQRKWWDRVPKGWKIFGDHYKIARAMTRAEYNYLRALPLVLHVPSEHAFLVHAGLLPYDPTRSITSQRQPLARLPVVRYDADVESGSIPHLRNAQERAILEEVKQNNDPWVVLNMRNLLKDKTVSRKTKSGTPWSEVWNSVMPRCSGYEIEHKKDKDDLPCHPSTVIYGHAAARGLDVKRWTIGLDSGCVYGRRLTAMVLDQPHRHVSNITSRADGDEDEDATPNQIPFGDDGQARLITVKCHIASTDVVGDDYR